MNFLTAFVVATNQSRVEIAPQKIPRHHRDQPIKSWNIREGKIDRAERSIVSDRVVAWQFDSETHGACQERACVSHVRKPTFSLPSARFYLHQLGLVFEARGSKSRASSGTVCSHLCHVSTAQTTMASLFPLLRPRRQIPRRRERYISFPQRSFPAYGTATCLRC